MIECIHNLKEINCRISSYNKRTWSAFCNFLEFSKNTQTKIINFVSSTCLSMMSSGKKRGETIQTSLQLALRFSPTPPVKFGMSGFYLCRGRRSNCSPTETARLQTPDALLGLLSAKPLPLPLFLTPPRLRSPPPPTPPPQYPHFPACHNNTIFKFKLAISAINFKITSLTFINIGLDVFVCCVVCCSTSSLKK